MARGSKEKYTSKQKRQAHHIEDSAKNKVIQLNELRKSAGPR